MNPVQILQRAHSEIQAGNLPEAEQLLKKLLSRKAKNIDALTVLGELSINTGNFLQAVKCFERLCKIRKNDPIGHYHLGIALLGLEQYARAVIALQKAVSIKSDMYPAYVELCNAAMRSGDLVQALDAGRKAVELEPEHAGGHNNLAGVFESLGHKQAALEHFQKAADLEPENPVILKNLADSLVSAGNKEAARICYQKALQYQPTYGEACRRLLRLDSFKDKNDPEFSRIKTLLTTQRLADTDRCQFHFALARMYKDCSDYDNEFKQLLKANAFEHQHCGLDATTVATQFDKVMSVFNKDFMTLHQDDGSHDLTPVFIIGMPRSGTTLVEQIISSHPHAYGAGELFWFNRVVADLSKTLNSKRDYPECINDIEPPVLNELAGNYLTYLKTLTDKKYQRITNKLPENYFHLGLIALIFPAARIIHCKRNPADNAVSIFREIFPGQMRYGYDLKTLGVFYKEYLRLMAHWESVLPGRITTIEYEDLVSRQQAGIHDVITAADLDWHDDCLQFYNYKRSISTASDLQVREPLHTRSINSWKNYEKYLEPFFNGLHSH